MRWAALLLATAVSAAAQCNYSFSPPEISLGPLEFTNTIQVYANQGCAWIAQSQAPDWIQIFIGGTGLGPGQFVLRVKENLSPEARTGTVTMQNATLVITQQGAACNYVLTPASMRVTTARGTNGFYITSRCGWTARSDSSWIRLTAPGSTGVTTGIGNGAVVFNYDENPSTIPRTGSITIAPGVSFRITQDGTACEVTLPTFFANAPPQGGSASFDVRSECIWSARPDVPWIRFEESISSTFVEGSGNGRIKFAVSPNTSTSTRSGTITVANKVFTVFQGGGVCTYSVTPPFASFTATGGTTTFRVNTPEGCVWTAIPNFPAWVSAVPGSGFGPGNVTVTVAPNDSGEQRSSVITVQGTTFGVVQSPDPAPAITTILNAASLEPAAVAPGQIVLIRGERIGPVDQIEGEADFATFLYKTELQGLRVFFDGIPVPILSASAWQIRTVVPYALAGRDKVEVKVEYLGRVSNIFVAPVDRASPGIFTLSETGRGPALARTEDYQFSNASNPILLGSEMIFYMTGEGLSEPPGVDGRIIGEQLYHPVLAVRVFLDDVQLETTYVGSAPGQVTGLLQVNVKVPFTAPTGDALPLRVFVAQYPAQAGVTVSVRGR